MPLIQKFDDAKTYKEEGKLIIKLLPAELLKDKRINIELLEIEKDIEFIISNSSTELSWIQIIEGSLSYEDINYDSSKLLYFGLACKKKFKVQEKTTIIISRVPNGKIFENEKFIDTDKNFYSVDWHKEPILNSEHDSRKRIYLISEALAKTNAVKGELIIYPPNTSAPEHYHEGAEHYQLIISGEINAVLNGAEYKLKKYDLVYNFENENHWFYNSYQKDCHFVEFFIPGHSKTIWSPEAKVCTWSPTGKNFKGGDPSRNIEKHIHGEGKGI